MVEYALILVLLAVSMGVVIYATGPAIGNVFCNVVYNLSGENANLCGGTDNVLANEGGRPDLFWGTVTWVAANRQGETPFPTPVLRPPLQEAREYRSPTPTATYTPSNTPTNTLTPTSTPTSSPGPSPTPSDLSFTVPHVDQMNKPEWWRLDRDLDMDANGVWNVTWYNTFSGSSAANFNLNSASAANTTQYTTADFSWYAVSGTVPAGSGLTADDVYGARATRTITLTESVTFLFRAYVNDWLRIKFNSDPAVVVVSSAFNWGTYTKTLDAGTHTITLEHVSTGNISELRFYMEKLSGNPDDVRNVGSATSPNPACQWGQESDDTNSGSRIYLMDENPSANSWTGGNTCYLELRGSIDLSPATNPVISFWDYWDFIGNSDASVRVELGNYTLVDGALDRSAFNWCAITLHSGNTANYNWTRNLIDIRSQCPSLGNRITVRFVASSGNSGNLRWRLDDIQVLDEPASATSYSVGAYWNLNSRSQMSDFVFNADSDYAVSDLYPTLPQNSGGGRRWNLTSNVSRDGTAWDDSPGYSYMVPDTNNSAASGTNSPYRVQYIEFKHDIDITTTRISGLTEDYEGDTGIPLFSFWFAYDVPVGASVRVQYSREARNRSSSPDPQNPDGWTDIEGGILLDYALPAGAPRLNEQTTRRNLSMQLIEIPLTNANIPNVDTAPFRLRVALYLTDNYPVGSGTAATAGDGIYIDDIRIERQSTVSYLAYPFADDAEDSSRMAAYWRASGNSPRWGQESAPRFGALNTATSYGDSPGTTYAANATTSLQMKKLIDLLHDTPANDVDIAGRAPAVDPLLTFYFARQVTGSSVTLSVDLYSPANGSWSPIWVYDSAADTTFRTQVAWERAEINLEYAIANVLGVPWSTIASDSDLENDDFRIRFRFDTGSDAAAEGVYVDQIEIKDAPAFTHRLWDAGAVTGNGTGQGSLEDSFDFVSPPIVGATGAWDVRWYFANWDQTSASGYVRRGSFALADSVSGQYAVTSRNILEFIPIIDLRSTPDEYARMYFWTRYAIASNDNFRVEVAVETPSNTTIGYDNLAGWSDWTPVATSVTGAGNVEKANTQNNLWVREDVNLSGFLGSRIRVRFVLNVPNSTQEADGIFIDDVTFTYGTTIYPLDFTEPAQYLNRWVVEGNWGITQQFFYGTGTDPANLGASPWKGVYFDCENNGGACDSSWGENVAAIIAPFLNTFTNYNSPEPVAIDNQISPVEIIADIDAFFGDCPAPPGSRPTVSVRNSLGDAFCDNWGVRWIRPVQLTAGVTYNFQTFSDDGVRLWINDRDGTTATAFGTPDMPTDAGWIINRWDNHSVARDDAQLTITSPTDLTDRYLYLEFFENGGNATIGLSAAVNSFSISDSPNTWNGSGWVPVTSTVPGNASIMLDGFIDLSDTSRSYYLEYARMWDVSSAPNNAFYVEVSTDGGFTWTTIGSETISGSSENIRPTRNWEDRIIDLTAYEGNDTVTFRFRIDTRSATVGDDGYFITNIAVRAV